MSDTNNTPITLAEVARQTGRSAEYLKDCITRGWLRGGKSESGHRWQIKPNDLWAAMHARTMICRKGNTVTLLRINGLLVCEEQQDTFDFRSSADQCVEILKSKNPGAELWMDQKPV